MLRRAGSLVSMPWRTGSSGPARSMGAGCSETTDINVAIASPRLKGGRPSTAAYSVAPSDQRSTAGRGSSPLARSGAMPKNSVERIDGEDLRKLASASKALLGTVARDARDQARVLADRRRDRKAQVRRDPTPAPDRSVPRPPRRRRFKRRWVVVPVLTTAVLAVLLLVGAALALLYVLGLL